MEDQIRRWDLRTYEKLAEEERKPRLRKKMGGFGVNEEWSRISNR